MRKTFTSTDLTAAFDLASKVGRACWGPENGVVVAIDTNEDDLRFVIWTTLLGGQISRHYLTASCTGEQRLAAHVTGFIENVQRAARQPAA